MRLRSGTGIVSGPALAGWAAAVALILSGGPQAAAAERPPSAHQFQQRTEEFLAMQAARAGTPAPRARGGIGVAPLDPAVDAPLFGGNLAVALYGAPQLTATAIGKRSPAGAARKLRRQARAYARVADRPVALSLNLIGVVATASAGSDRRYRARQDPAVIRTYLKAARSVGARLTLDIQPGRARLIGELRALRQWIALPDVDVGIDPEWNVGRKGVPGRDEGSIGHRTLNRASRWLERLAERKDVPAKALIVHQFRAGSISGRRRIKQREGASVLLNFDGIGSRRAKRAGYKNLAANSGLLDGFSLFYDRDLKLMKPRSVLRLRPEVDYAMYQ
jgi:hypothetical protein